MKTFTIVLIAACIIFILFIIIESVREIRQLKITSYTLAHSKLPKEFVGYKLILLSDLHNCFYNTDKIVSIIREQKPNGVIIAGDMLVYGDKEEEANLTSIELIKTISKYSDVYFAPGNHEMGYMLKKKDEWLTYEKALLNSKNDNIYFLDNKVIELERGKAHIKIYGLHLTDGYYKRFIKKKLTRESLDTLLGTSDLEGLNILIAHNPDYFAEYCQWGADIVLSGHNHGGLMKLPLLGGVISPRLRIFPKYDCGMFVEEDSMLILSGGLGAHSLRIRVNNKPEIVIIELDKK